MTIDDVIGYRSNRFLRHHSMFPKTALHLLGCVRNKVGHVFVSVGDTEQAGMSVK